MSKDWIRPIEVYRTPEQHRLVIQKVGKPSIPKPKKVKKHKRGRWKQIPGFETYADYLKSDAWKSIRSRWMHSKLCRGDKCHAAGCSEVYFLSLHHRTYQRIGREQLKDLVLVCNKCHEKIHALEKSGMLLHDATKKVVGY